MYEIEIVKPNKRESYGWRLRETVHMCSREDDYRTKGLQVYFNGVEIKRPDYDLGKFFFFVMIGNGKALKFVHRKFGKDNYCGAIPKLEKIIKIQNILSRKGLTFSCEEEIVRVRVKYLLTNKTKEYNGYVTNARPDPWTINTKDYCNEQYENFEFIQKMHSTCLSNNIWRPHFENELRKRKNYVIDSHGIRYVDIDPKFYFTTCDKHLKSDIINEGQWPYHRRNRPYQSIEESGILGIRNTSHRIFLLFHGTTFRRKTVLDLGCNIGAMCKFARYRRAKLSVGIDSKEEVINVARKYFNTEGCENINLVTYDINNGLEKLQVLIGKNKFDYVFALSMLKHVDNKALFDIINYYTKEKCWIEGHNKQDKDEIHGLLENNLNVKEIKFLGYTYDRGIRPNFVGNNN